MADTQLKTRIVLRNDSKNSWDAVKSTAVLLKGEIGIEFNPLPTAQQEYTVKIKIGDGINTWEDLPYFGDTPGVDNTTIALNSDNKLTLNGFASAATGSALRKTANGIEWVTIYSQAQVDAIIAEIETKVGNSTDEASAAGSLFARLKQEINDRIANYNALDARIDALEGRGRFLSAWNATTGLPATYPDIAVGESYLYKTGDYYIVSTVGATGNKKPAGTAITRDSATTWSIPSADEANELYTNDYYLFDGTTWTLLHNSTKVATWGNITGTLSNQTDLTNALDQKLEKVTVKNIQVPINNKTANIDLADELTYDSTDKKLKITRPGTANGQVLTAKSDGTIAWETVGTGDILFKDSSKTSFATKAQFDTAATSGTFYLADGTQKSSSLIVKGDYVIITADETHDGSQARYGYQAVAGNYQASNWVFEYTLGSAYTGGNGIQINGTTISTKLDGTSLTATSNGLKINDGWTSGSALIINGGNANLTE